MCGRYWTIWEGREQTPLSMAAEEGLWGSALDCGLAWSRSSSCGHELHTLATGTHRPLTAFTKIVRLRTVDSLPVEGFSISANHAVRESLSSRLFPPMGGSVSVRLFLTERYLPLNGRSLVVPVHRSLEETCKPVCFWNILNSNVKFYFSPLSTTVRLFSPMVRPLITT